MFLFIALFFTALLLIIIFMLYKGGGFSIKNSFRRAVINGFWAGKERRQHVRFKKNLDVNYIERKNRQAKNSGKTIDISMGGIRLLLEEKFQKGAVLLIKIILPDTKKAVEVEGEIVWSEEIDGQDSEGKRLFHAGVQFIAVKNPSDDYLLEYIRSLPQSQEIP